MSAAAHHPLRDWHVDRPHRMHRLGDLTLRSGERLRDTFVSYVTHGELAPARDNAIAVLSAIGSTHHRLDFLIGPRKALDTERWFIVAIDALGNGLSISPSNSAAQPGASFPRLSIADMVESQRRLLAEVFGVQRLAAVVGASMGGMQALQWAVAHPDAMQRIVAMTPLAKTPPWTRLVNRVAREALGHAHHDDDTAHRLAADPLSGYLPRDHTDAIATASAADHGDAAAAWRRWALVFRALLNRSPAALEREADVDACVARLETDSVEQRLAPLDWIAQSFAYDAHDVGQARGFGGDTAKALSSVRARTLVLAPPLDLYNPAEHARWIASVIPGARFVEIPSVQGHQAANAVDAADVAFVNAQIAAFLSGP